ncbi:MAG: LysM peptidoglycan-binding domain-containing protein [Anaerolineae bacterium]
MEQNNTHHAAENQSNNRGLFEWLKFVIFFAGIILITVLAITVIGPIIFTQYVPPIIGLTEESTEVEIEPENVPEEPEAITPIESEVGPESTDPEDVEESSGEDSQEIDENETEPLQTEEETSGKVEDEESGAAESEITTVVYIVQPGDTLTSIATVNQLTVEQILAANDLVNPNLLKAGQEILIPQ